jgi:hypothetical protein
LNSITYSNMQYIYNHLTSMSHTPCSNYNVRVTRAVVVAVVEVVVVATRHHGSTPHCGLSLCSGRVDTSLNRHTARSSTCWSTSLTGASSSPARITHTPLGRFVPLVTSL